MNPSPETPPDTDSADVRTDDRPASSPLRRIFKICLRLFLVVLAIPLLLIAAAFVFPIRINLDRWSETFDRELTELIGRELTIDGDLTLITGGHPSIEVTDLRLENPPDWPSGGDLAHLGRFKTTIGLSELFHREIAIDDIIIERLRLYLERTPEGEANWDGLAASFSNSKPEAESDEPLLEDVFSLSSTGFDSILIEEIEVLAVQPDEVAGAPNRPIFLRRLEASAPAGEPIPFQVQGTLHGLPFEAEGEGGTLTTLVTRDEPWPLTVRGKLGQSRFEISGHRFTNNFETPGLVQFDVEIPELEELFPLTGDLPSIGSLHLSGVAERHAPDLFELKNFEGNLGKSPVTGSASLDLSAQVPQLNGEISVEYIFADIFRRDEDPPESDDPPASAPPARKAPQTVRTNRTEVTSQPFHGELRLQIGDFRGIDTPATIRDIDLRASISEEVISAEVTAVFAEMPLEGRVDIKANTQKQVLFAMDLTGGKARLTELVTHYLGNEKFEGELESLHYRIEGQGTWLAEAWEDRSVLLEVTGANIAYPLFGKEYRFLVDEGSISHRSEPEATIALKGDFREEPFSVTMELVRTAESAGEEVRIRHATGQFADIEVDIVNEGLARPFSAEDIRVAFQLSGDRLDKLDHVYELNLPPIGPYSASGTYRQNPGRVTLEDVKLTVGNSGLNGRCEIEKREDRLNLNLDLSSPTIQLDDFATPNWSPIEGTTNSSGSEDSGIATLFSHEVLNRFDGELKLNVGEVLSGRDRLGKGSVTARLQNARLTLSPLVLGLPGGEFKGDGSLHPKSDGSLDWRLEMAAKNFDVGVIARRKDPDTVFRGFADLDLALQATGVPYGKPHLKESTGTLDIDFCPENLDSSNLDIWVRNLILLLLPQLDPKNQSTVNCIIGRLHLKDGLITTDTLGMDTTTMRVSAVGEIDLARETIQLKLEPVSKRPRLFSLQVPVAIEGSLDNPEFVMGRLPTLRALTHLTKNTILFPANLLLGDRLPADGSDICSCRKRGE